MRFKKFYFILYSLLFVQSFQLIPMLRLTKTGKVTSPSARPSVPLRSVTSYQQPVTPNQPTTQFKPVTSTGAVPKVENSSTISTSSKVGMDGSVTEKTEWWNKIAAALSSANIGSLMFGEMRRESSYEPDPDLSQFDPNYYYTYLNSPLGNTKVDPELHKILTDYWENGILPYVESLRPVFRRKTNQRKLTEQQLKKVAAEDSLAAERKEEVRDKLNEIYKVATKESERLARLKPGLEKLLNEVDKKSTELKVESDKELRRTRENMSGLYSWLLWKKKPESYNFYRPEQRKNIKAVLSDIIERIYILELNEIQIEIFREAIEKFLTNKAHDIRNPQHNQELMEKVKKRYNVRTRKMLRDTGLSEFFMHYYLKKQLKDSD